jgi:hypothetical protein
MTKLFTCVNMLKLATLKINSIPWEVGELDELE